MPRCLTQPIPVRQRQPFAAGSAVGLWVVRRSWPHAGAVRTAPEAEQGNPTDTDQRRRESDGGKNSKRERRP